MLTSIIFNLLFVLTSGYVSSLQRNTLTNRYQKRCCALYSENPSIKSATASISLVKKGKMKYVQSLLSEIKEGGDDHIINQFLKDGTRPFGVGNPINFYKAITNNKGTVSIMAEFNKKSKTGFIIGMPPPEILGGVLRDAGARAIIVSMDSRSGGATANEFERFTIEQTKARIFLPGPIPIIWNDLVVDKIQIAFAATCGAAAITIWPEFIDNVDEYVKYAKQLNVEPIVMVKTVTDGQEAINAGAQCLCIHTLEETAMIDTKILITNLMKRNDIVFFGRLRPEEDFSLYHEIDMSWNLRDQGFCAVWPSPEAIYATGMRDIYPNIMAMRAKASKQFLSPRQFLMDRNKEGATEYLGDILY